MDTGNGHKSAGNPGRRGGEAVLGLTYIPINNIQLFWDGSRWWVMSILWDNERPGLRLPPELGG